jgi:hypothetical protein
MKIGCAGVSTFDQNAGFRVDALKKPGAGKYTRTQRAALNPLGQFWMTCSRTLLSSDVASVSAYGEVSGVSEGTTRVIGTDGNDYLVAEGYTCTLAGGAGITAMAAGTKTPFR